MVRNIPLNPETGEFTQPFLYTLWALGGSELYPDLIQVSPSIRFLYALGRWVVRNDYDDNGNYVVRAEGRIETSS